MSRSRSRSTDRFTLLTWSLGWKGLVRKFGCYLVACVDVEVWAKYTKETTGGTNQGEWHTLMLGMIPIE